MKSHRNYVIIIFMSITEEKLIKYPLKLTPSVCRHVWGGVKLIRDFNKVTSNDTLSECWEVSVNDKLPSIISNGVYEGMTLSGFIREFPESLGKGITEFKLLIKLIDSAAKLSVQVHPDDAYALEHEGELGKTEAWYILDASEDAYIYLGFKEDIGRELLETSITGGTIEKYLNKITVKQGQSYVVEAGTVHAIGEGVTLLEIQENSSITYRAYDYNRADLNGKLRELHIDKALEVTNLNKLEEPAFKQFNTYLHGKQVKVVAMSDYFTSYLVKGGIAFGFNEPALVTVISGDGAVISKGESVPARKGDSFFIPAALDCRIMGSIKFVLTIEGDK